MDEPTGNKKLSTDKARQGKRGMPVLAVLVVALVLAMIAWVAVEFYGQEISSEAPPGQISTEPESGG